MRWYWKCLIDSAKAMVPLRTQVRRWKHQVCGYPTDPINDRVTTEQGLLLIDSIQSLRPFAGITILEVGTGWRPIIPILYSMAGAQRVLLTDLRPLCSASTIAAAAASLRANKQLIVSRLSLSDAQFDAALSWKPDWSFADILRHLRLEYLAPCDCQNLDLPAASVDAVVSRAVLEHIPPPVVQGIFRESFRILRENGLNIHIIDNSDHWQHADASLSRLNFLRFPESVFRWTYLNGLNYQNRLRHSQYLEFLQSSGFSILRQEGSVDTKSLADLAHIPLAEPFRRFTQQDLAILTTFVIAAKPQPLLVPTEGEARLDYFTK